MKALYSENAPKALGPYAQAQQVGNLIFCSGQTGINPETGLVEADTVEGQTRQVLDNLSAVLSSKGLTIQQVVKCNVYLSSMDNFERMNQMYGEMFAPHTPARTTVAVAGLPLNALVEIECIAEMP